MQVIGNRRRLGLAVASTFLIAITSATPTAADVTPQRSTESLGPPELSLGSATTQPRHTDPLPRLRLVAAEQEILQVRPEGSPVVLDAHTWLAVDGGDFELHVTGVDTGEISLVQVLRDADGQVTRQRRLPATLVGAVDQGLAEFFDVTVRLRDEIVASVTAGFCPANWDRARVDDEGVDLDRYPQGCWTHELTQGMVWGIPRSWAVRAPEFWQVQLDLEDGTYDLEIAIADTYRRLLGVHGADASVTMALTVTTGDDVIGEDVVGPVPPIVDPHDADADRAVTAQVSASASGLPDLIALPAWNISTAIPEGVEVPAEDVLTFAANVWNGGDGPLVVEGFRRLGEPFMDAYQYFYEDGANVGRELVGTLEFDPQDGHRHWHFTDFAEYTLLDTTGAAVAKSGKEAFCLANTHAIDMTLPNANWTPSGTGLSTSCGFFGALWIRQILDVGWGDTYVQSLPGQWIDITEVANGEYVLEVATNQDGRIEELRADNNVAHVSLLLGGQPGARTVEVLPSP